MNVQTTDTRGFAQRKMVAMLAAFIVLAATVLVLLLTCAPALAKTSPAPSGRFKLETTATFTAESSVAPSERFVVATEADDDSAKAPSVSQLAKTTSRDKLVVKKPEPVKQNTASNSSSNGSSSNAGSNGGKSGSSGSSESGGGSAKSTPAPSSDWKTNQASFYEYNINEKVLGVAVDRSMLGTYPKGTVVELSWNGTTVRAVVNDCGYWASKGGNTYRMFDLQENTCDALGWTSAKRWKMGVIDVQWRVVSYG